MLKGDHVYLELDAAGDNLSKSKLVDANKKKGNGILGIG